MGCLGSKPVPKMLELGVHVTPSEQEVADLNKTIASLTEQLTYYKGKSNLLEREVNFLESRVEAETELVNAWKTKFWAARQAELSLSKGLRS